MSLLVVHHNECKKEENTNFGRYLVELYEKKEFVPALEVGAVPLGSM